MKETERLYVADKIEIVHLPAFREDKIADGFLTIGGLMDCKVILAGEITHHVCAEHDVYIVKKGDAKMDIRPWPWEFDPVTGNIFDTKGDVVPPNSLQADAPELLFMLEKLLEHMNAWCDPRLNPGLKAAKDLIDSVKGEYGEMKR